MRITAIHIDGFGKFKNYNIEPGDGINIISGLNEAGKSTLHSFIRAMFFGFSGGAEKKTLYEAMRPWDETSSYGGYMSVEEDGIKYRILRDFGIAPDNLFVKNEDTGLMESDPAGIISALLSGMTESAYINTVSIGQLKAATEKRMGEELVRYVRNINTTGNPSLNAEKAIAWLNREKERLTGEIDLNAAAEYTSVMGRIKNLERSLDIPENENRINLYEDASKRARTEIGGLLDEQNLLDEEISRGEDILRAASVKDEAQIARDGEKAASLYQLYVSKLPGMKSNVKKILIIVFLVLAAAAAACGIWAVPGQKTGLLCFAAAACFLIIAVIMFIRRRSFRRIFEEDYAELQDIIAAYIKDQEISAPDETVMSGFNGKLEELRKVCRETDAAREKLGGVRSELSALNDEAVDIISKLQAQMETKRNVERQLAEMNALRSHGIQLRRILENNQRIQEKTDAIDLAIENLSDLSEQVRNTIGAYVNAEASRIIEGVTGGVYKSLDAGKGSDICLNTKDRMIPVGQVSAGTMDQVYLALRIASVRLIADGKDMLPLIFDDSFVLYDDQRLGAALRFIAGYYKGQILIFTCHSREQKILSEEGIEYKLTDL